RGVCAPGGKVAPFPAGKVRAVSATRAARRFGPADRRPASAPPAPKEARVRTASLPRGESPPLSKPKGGYLLIPAGRLALAWWAYHENLIRLVDLRVWFAACEMVARRCGRPTPLPHRFGLDELQRLTGLSPKRLKDSLRRLTAARLLSWSKSAITFPAT